jgi:hypothetical protein
MSCNRKYKECIQNFGGETRRECARFTHVHPISRNVRFFFYIKKKKKDVNHSKNITIDAEILPTRKFLYRFDTDLLQFDLYQMAAKLGTFLALQNGHLETRGRGRWLTFRFVN